MSKWLAIDGSRTIPREELTVRASRSGGAGGQHVNTSSTRIEVTWNPGASSILSDEEKERLASKLGTKLDRDGELRVVASDTRSQTRNRELAEERLAELVREALRVPRVRKATKPSRAAKQARIDQKKRQSERKKRRGYRPGSLED